MFRKVRIFVGFAAVLAGANGASASLIEDFDGYADQAAFQAAWPSWFADGTSMTLKQNLGLTGIQSVGGVATANSRYRNYRNLDSFSAYAGTDAKPVEFELSVYDADPTKTGARNFCELRAYDASGGNEGMPSVSGGAGYGLQAIIALGLYNTPAAGTYDFRVYGGGANAWYSTGVARKAGWHKMTALIGSTAVNVYVDDVLTNTVTLKTPIPAFDGVVLGSGLTSAGYDAAFDNLSVASVPEPVTVLLLAAGGLFTRRRCR
jgi:hypothetical protein